MASLIGSRPGHAGQRRDLVSRDSVVAQSRNKEAPEDGPLVIGVAADS